MFYTTVAALLFSAIAAGQGRKCQNEYRYVLGPIKVGRYARVSPDRDVYYPEDVVRFKCAAGYYFESPFYRDHEEMWIKCMKGYRWLEDWPICRGPLENVTCENMYQFAEHHGKWWLNQTVNEFHATYSPKQTHYKYGQSLRFKCPQNSKIYRTSGLTVMTTACLKDSMWSQEWPMCKGRTCKSLYVKNGVINDKNKKLSIGIKLNFKCKPGYHLWGPNRTTCLGNLEWSGYPQECITLEKFERNCRVDKRVMKIKYHGYQQQPYCYSEQIQRGSNHYKIAVGISVPMAIGFLIFIVTASFYVKHQRIKMAREREMYLRQESRHNRMLASLPSYEEAVKNKPTASPPSFLETFGFVGNETENHLLLLADDIEDVDDAIPTAELPPEYTPHQDLPPQAIISQATISNDSNIELPPEYTENPSLCQHLSPEGSTHLSAECTEATSPLEHSESPGNCPVVDCPVVDCAIGSLTNCSESDTSALLATSINQV